MFQIRVFNNFDEAVEESSGYESEGEAHRAAVSIRHAAINEIDRVEIFVDGFRKCVGVV